jgi:predicted ATPase
MQRYILTGGPGGGKTTLLQLLESAGYTCVPEVARSIIRERKEKGLSPRPEAIEFAAEILRLDIQEYERLANFSGPVFFDRGIGDALCMLYNCSSIDILEARQYCIRYPYSSPVFLLPPWESIFVNDGERDQTFEDALHISERLARWYESLGYPVVEVPSGSPNQRLAFILRTVGFG